jgi:hypothetical protein
VKRAAMEAVIRAAMEEAAEEAMEAVSEAVMEAVIRAAIRRSACCIKQSIFQQQYTRHNAVKYTDMEIANLASLCHGRASCRESMQVVSKQQAKTNEIFIATKIV